LAGRAGLGVDGCRLTLAPRCNADRWRAAHGALNRQSLNKLRSTNSGVTLSRDEGSRW
jgi:hypothetical protein